MIRGPFVFLFWAGRRKEHMGRAFSPAGVGALKFQGVALGWYGSAPLALKSRAVDGNMPLALSSRAVDGSAPLAFAGRRR